LAKKIPVLNSPWGRPFERPSDCARWIAQGHAILSGGTLSFTEKFFKVVQRQNLEFDPVGADDGIARRWARCTSGKSTPALQAIDGQLLGVVKIKDRDGNVQTREGKIVISAGRIATKQLLEVNHVGTGRLVSKRHDRLERRQGRRDHGRSILPTSSEVAP
jgi:hypothetical protein